VKRLRLIAVGLLVAGFLVVPGCVELTGQRITWFYDRVQDRLHFLIHYDGIHEGKGFRMPSGDKQIPEFVQNGDVMLGDWPFHLQHTRLAKVRDSGDPLQIAWVDLVTHIQTRNLGYYREPDGRIGAAQLVTIPAAKDFLAKLNGLIGQQIQNDSPARSEQFPRTLERILKAARADHQWVTLNGHSLRISLPVHPAEWARAKGTLFQQVFDQVIREQDNPEENGQSLPRALVELFASAPLSYLDEGDRVTFVLGRPDQPTTLRLAIRETYEPSLEDDVIKAVAVDLDRELARALLDPDAELSAELEALRSWGPPEDQVRALLSAGTGESAQQRRVIAERLARWGAQWNREGSLPVAPLELDPDEFSALWIRWYDKVRHPGSGH
jgi:hypothetical protein